MWAKPHTAITVTDKKLAILIFMGWIQSVIRLVSMRCMQFYCSVTKEELLWHGCAATALDFGVIDSKFELIYSCSQFREF